MLSLLSSRVRYFRPGNSRQHVFMTRNASEDIREQSTPRDSNQQAAMTGKKLVSVAEAAVTGERVTSPRSLEACRRMGIDASELLPR